MESQRFQQIFLFKCLGKSQKYIKEGRLQLGGFIPERTTYAKPIKAPPKNIFESTFGDISISKLPPKRNKKESWGPKL